MATFAELYTPLLKEVFTIQAQQQLDAGANGLEAARAYAERGKPDFVLAYLLLIDAPEEDKREILAYSYERRATLSEQKAASLSEQFDRPFPLIKLEVQKDHMNAQRIRQGKRVRQDAATKMLRIN